MEDISGEIEWTKYLPLVRTIARQIAARTSQSSYFNDYFQIGSIALWEASKTYQSGLGAAFETYARIRVSGAIMDEIRRTVWISRHMQQGVKAVVSMRRVIESETLRPATDMEIRTRLGISPEDYNGFVQASAGARQASLNDLMDLGDSVLDLDDAGRENPLHLLEKEEGSEEAIGLIDMLPAMERDVVIQYFYSEYALVDIGEILRVSESRVCQILASALLRLRQKGAVLRGLTPLDACPACVISTSGAYQDGEAEVFLLAISEESLCRDHERERLSLLESDESLLWAREDYDQNEELL